ncbi:MAG: hypothetical protein IKK38_05905, partial [Spirochaetaceae bacterium]|nr:hypothetical protein [Spirochaetaceae bacterium]
ERTPTQSVRGIVRSAKELHSGLIPFISPQRGMFPTETGIKPSARIKVTVLVVSNTRQVVTAWSRCLTLTNYRLIIFLNLNIRQFSTPKFESVKPKSKLISKLKDFGKYMILWLFLFAFIYGITSFFTREDPILFHLCIAVLVIVWLFGVLFMGFVFLGSD